MCFCDELCLKLHVGTTLVREKAANVQTETLFPFFSCSCPGFLKLLQSVTSRSDLATMKPPDRCDVHGCGGRHNVSRTSVEDTVKNN